MVADEYRLAHLQSGPDAAGRVGEDHGAGAGGDRGPHRMHDAGEVVSLVRMGAAEQDQDREIADPHRQHRSGVPGRGRRREPGQVGHRHGRDGNTERVGGGPPPGSQYDGRRVLRDAGALGEDVGGLLFECAHEATQ